MAMLWFRQLAAHLSLWRPRFAARSVHAEFMVDEVTLRQVFLQVLQIPLSISFHHGCPFSYIIWGMNNRPIGDRSSEILSHPAGMINNNMNNLVAQFYGCTTGEHVGWKILGWEIVFSSFFRLLQHL
jgi:hypothetical protein